MTIRVRCKKIEHTILRQIIFTKFFREIDFTEKLHHIYLIFRALCLSNKLNNWTAMHNFDIDDLTFDFPCQSRTYIDHIGSLRYKLKRENIPGKKIEKENYQIFNLMPLSRMFFTHSVHSNLDIANKSSDTFCSLYRIICYIKCNMLCKSSKWELVFVHYIAEFTISRLVISRFEYTIKICIVET